MLYKILLYIILGFVLSILIGSRLEAQDNIAPQAPTKPVVRTSPQFERIAYCESKNDAHAKNKYSTASGRFQFIHSSWYHYGLELWGDKFYEKNVWDYEDNTELAWYVYQKNGVRDWESSRKCWSNV